MTHSAKRVLITGGAGFIGSNLVRTLLSGGTVERVVVLDALTYAGHLVSLEGVDRSHDERFRFVRGDICDGPVVSNTLSDERIDTIIHLAAESHVDRSIDSPLVFVQTNVMGTATLLQAASAFWNGRKDVRFHHVSTDEVFGSLGESGFFDEETPYDPSSPYSASKAGSDHLVRAWGRTFAVPVTISNCSNNYGPYQHPEKLIPHIILRALAGETLPIYGKGTNIRDWLYVEDHCEAILRIVEAGIPGRTYCIGGDAERRNIEVAHQICDILQTLVPSGGPFRDLIEFVPDRPGHDQRYAINHSRLGSELGWAPRESFASGLERTVRWYLERGDWISVIKGSGFEGMRRGLRR